MSPRSYRSRRRLSPAPADARRSCAAFRPQVPRGCLGRKLIGTQVLRLRHRRRATDALHNELVERYAAQPLGDDGQDHEAAVVVGELLTRLRHGREAIEDREKVITGRQLMYADRHHDSRRCPRSRPHQGSPRCLSGAPSSARWSPCRRSAARSSPSTDRALVSNPSRPSSTRLITAQRGESLGPLGDRKSRVDAIGDLLSAIGPCRTPLRTRASPRMSILTTPEKSSRVASSSIASCQRQHDLDRSPRPDRAVDPVFCPARTFGKPRAVR